MIADSNNFFFECDRSNSNAKIPHVHGGKGRPSNKQAETEFHCFTNLCDTGWVIATYRSSN